MKALAVDGSFQYDNDSGYLSAGTGNDPDSLITKQAISPVWEGPWKTWHFSARTTRHAMYKRTV
jgi:hypothetical protein